MVNSLQANNQNCTLTFVNSTNSGISLNLTSGDVSVSNSVPIGTYTLTYQICSNGSVSNCTNGIVTVNVICNLSPTFDLIVKDGIDDIGLQPNNNTQFMWTSTDIWIRNQPDGIDSHQNPEYSSNAPNYTYVRVKNKSCITSTGNEQLKLYWAKAGSSLQWPESWEGNNFFPSPNPAPLNNTLLGNTIGTVAIPILQPGQETILQIPFLVPNPTDYSFAGSDQWHFCLLARIEALNDQPIESNDLYSNVQNNNNIAWKNITIVDLLANRTEGVISVGNPFNEPKKYTLEIVKADSENGKPIYDEAEVSIKMDETFYNAWERGGKLGQKLEATNDERKFIITGNNAKIDNLSFKANEIGILNLTFSFLTKELTEKSKFIYNVIQKDALTGRIIGGETYQIVKDSRTKFIANAGDDLEVNKNQTIIISANQINEAAIYNWYDVEGNLVFTGKDLTVSTNIATKYKLEVIAVADGFKDYSEIEIKLKPCSLGIISPNPASNYINVNYKLNNVNSAYLMLIGKYPNNGISNNYILDINSTGTNINLNNYPNGLYTIALICDGLIIDAKTISKQ